MLTQSAKEKEPMLYVIHNGIRQDIQLFMSVGKHWPKLEKKQFQIIRDYIEFHLGGVEYHHAAEEHFFFPAYDLKAPQFHTALQTLHHQHEDLIESIRLLREALQKDDRTKLEALTSHYCLLVDRHLTEEEDTVYLPILELYTVEESLALAEAYSKTTSSASKRGLIARLPWVMHYMDEDARKEFFKKLPFFVPLVYRLSLKPKFDKKIAVFKAFKT